MLIANAFEIPLTPTLSPGEWEQLRVVRERFKAIGSVGAV
jgi:hypothetical protein